MKTLSSIILFSAAAVLLGEEPQMQEERASVCRFDLTAAGLQKLDNGNFLWRIPADREQSQIVFDLEKCGVLANDYDELRILFRNRKGISGFGARLTNYPAKDQLRSWYSKIALPENRFIDLRFDLRLDDDGWWFGNPVMEGRRLELTLMKKYRRIPGEAPDRETEIAAVELLRRRADLRFSELAAVLSEKGGSISWRYELIVQNRETRPLKMKLALDTSGLKHFRTDWTERKLSLAPRETVTAALTLSIGKDTAAKLPPLYSERVLPKLMFADAPDVFPLIGYRPRYVWGTIPPAASGYKLALPSSEKEKAALIGRARLDAARPFAAPPQTAPAYCAIFKPREMEALSFFRIRDRRTGRDLSAEKGVAASYIYHYNANTFQAMKRMAQAYRLTGNPAYAEKIRDILLEYVHWFGYLPPRAPSSTSAGSRLTSTTLDLSYFLLSGVEAYAAVRDSAVFGAADRERIESEFLAPLMYNLYTHNIEFTNMQLHHIATYASAALILKRHLNLLGDALYGDHGFFNFERNGFTADGMALEGGVYHWFGLAPLLDFMEKMRAYGVELAGPRFKRIYDYGIENTPQGIADGNLRATYPTAWRLFRNPDYLPTLKLIGRLPRGMDPRAVPDTLFLGSKVQKNNGYVWLRENSNYGFRALAINYIMGWDRLEHDRLHFRLFDGEGMLSHEVWRVGYTNPGADMEATVSHNTVVVDEKNSAVNPSELAAFLDRKSMPGFLIAERAGSPLYPGIAFSRAGAIFDGILFIGDKWSAADGAEHTFDWPYYAPWQPWAKDGEWQFRLPGDFKTPFRASYPFVSCAWAAPAGKSLKASVDIPPSTLEKGFDVKRPADRSLYLHFALPRETLAVKFLIGRGHDPKPGPMLLLRQKGSSAEFACAFDVVKKGGKERVRAVRSLSFSPAHPLSAVWEISADSGTYYVIVNRTGGELVCGEIKTRKIYEVLKCEN